MTTLRHLFPLSLAALLLLLPGCPSSGDDDDATGDDDDATGDDDDATGDDDDATGDDDDATGDDDDATGDDDDATGDDDDATGVAGNLLIVSDSPPGWIADFDGTDITGVLETDLGDAAGDYPYLTAAASGPDGLLVAGSSSGAWASHSVDGVTWSDVSAGLSGNPTAAANGGGVWVVGTDTGIYYGDGSSWTLATGFTGDDPGDIAYGNGMFVTARGDRSADGATWTAATTPPPWDNFSAVGYDGTGRWMIAINEFNGGAYYSDDGGDTWTAGTVDNPGFRLVFDLAYGNGAWVVAHGDSSGTVDLLVSTNGVDFEEVTLSATYEQFHSVVYLDGLGFVLEGGSVFGGTTALHSTDGLTWTVLPSALPIQTWFLLER